MVRYLLNTFVVSSELKKYLDEKQAVKGEEKTMCLAITELIEDGRKEGQEEYRMLVNKLNNKLYNDGRMNDLKRTFTDMAYQDKLIKELFPDEWKILNNA